VTDAVLVLGYNANLLTITGAAANPALAGATLAVSTSGSGAAAQATITFHSGSGVDLGTLGSVLLGGLVASVPGTAPYKSKAVLQSPNQTGVAPASFAPGPDPVLSLPAVLQVGLGGTVRVPVELDDARPAGSTGLTQALLALRYDPAVWSVSAADVHLGSLP